jgi:drug/metabolite transporter (DMT)-like permease
LKFSKTLQEAQIEGMKSLGPYTFMAFRYTLGLLAALPLLFFVKREVNHKSATALRGGVAAGVLLFLGSAFQQVGLQDTTATNSGFITSLYLVIVPVMALFLGQRAKWNVWVGAGIAAVGLYWLSFSNPEKPMTLHSGDTLQLAGAFVWAAHVLCIGWFALRADGIRLALIQFASCAALSWLAVLCYESFTAAAVLAAMPSLLFAGVLSTALALNLQIIGQRHVPPARAALIMSTECIFAAVGGWLWLGDSRQYTEGHVGTYQSHSD